MNYTAKYKKNQQQKTLIEKCTNKKQKNQDVKHIVKKNLTEKMYKRFEKCGGFLKMVADRTLTKKKVHSGNYCKNRFCPFCRWREAKKDALKLSVLMLYLLEKKKEFIFLTLTTPNVLPDKLSDEITKYNKAFKKLIERQEVERVFKGYVRKLEITYDPNEFITEKLYKDKKDHYDRKNLYIGDKNPTYNTYHPHFHVLVCVNPSYFANKTYMKQEKWLDLWRDVMQDYSITQVDIRKFKGDTKKEVFEIATYSTKDDDLFNSQEVFDTFYKALKGRQILTYGGLFEEAQKLYKEGKLDYLKEIDDTEYVYMLLYHWGFKEYVEKEKRELTEEERKKINKKLIEEVEIE